MQKQEVWISNLLIKLFFIGFVNYGVIVLTVRSLRPVYARRIVLCCSNEVGIVLSISKC